MELRLIRVRAKTVDGTSWQPKTRRNRVVPVSEALFDVLRRHNPPQDSAWFFPSPNGRKWDPDNLSSDLRALNRARGLVWSCGDYRHTFGSHLAQKGESLYKIATLMGNSPEICRRHYAALIPEEMHDTVEFARPNGDGDDPPKDKTQALLEEVLKRLGGKVLPDAAPTEAGEGSPLARKPPTGEGRIPWNRDRQNTN